LEEFTKLVELMAALRGENGCPWDKKQPTKAFKTLLLEADYELIAAIEKDDYNLLKEELGDLLFHIVFIAQICKDEGHFDIRDVLSFLYNKMYNRHPHVFLNASTEGPIEEKWEELKKKEKHDYSPLSGVPSIMPALLRAYIITKRAAKIGFDWEKVDDVYKKLSEETEELRKAEQSADIKLIKEEIGDLIFTMVNLSRFYSVDPEDALRYACEKFIRRFAYVETKTDIKKSSLSEMDSLWNEIKDIEQKGE